MIRSASAISKVFRTQPAGILMLLIPIRFWFQMTNFVTRISLDAPIIGTKCFGRVNHRTSRMSRYQLRFKGPNVSWVLLLVFFGACSVCVYGQTPTDTQADKDAPPQTAPSQPLQFTPPSVDLKSLPKNLFLDQKDFWTAPLHMSQKQWEWTAPALSPRRIAH